MNYKIKYSNGMVQSSNGTAEQSRVRFGDGKVRSSSIVYGEGMAKRSLVSTRKGKAKLRTAKYGTLGTVIKQR